MGSYFGDCDLFPDLVNGLPSSSTERDSTGIADADSHFFVLQKDAFNKMSNVFHTEFKEIAILARKRRKRHRLLIKTLVAKVQQIF